MTEQNPAPPPGAVDARFTLAAERTMLAWLRTSLGLVAAGVAVQHVMVDFSTSTARFVFGIVLILLGAGAAVAGAWRWYRVTHALEKGGSMPGPATVWALTGGIVVVALAFAVFS